MAHGTTLNTGSGGDTMCTIDPTTVAASGFPTTGKQQAFVIYASAGANTAPTVYLLGQKARAASFGFTLSTEDVALLAEIEAGVDGLEALATTGNDSLNSILMQLQATQTTLENVATVSYQSAQTDLLQIIVNLLTPPTTGTADDFSYHELLVQIRDTIGTVGGGGGTGDASLAEQQTQTTHLSAIETATEAVQAAIASQATAAKQDALALLVDGIEAQLTTLAGHVDGIEGQLTTLVGHVDGLEAALSTLNSAVATAANQATANGHLANLAASDADTIRIGSTNYTVKRAVIAAASSGENTLVAAVSGKKIRVIAINFICAGAVSLYFNNATDGAIWGGSTNKGAFPSNGGIALGVNKYGWFTTGTNNEALRLNLSAAVAVAGSLNYIEV